VDQPAHGLKPEFAEHSKAEESCEASEKRLNSLYG
jgi:hypothetical protein